MTKSDIEARLAAIRAQHTGKAPFGPLDDLEELYTQLSTEERLGLFGLLQERRNNGFWSFFVTEFEKSHLGRTAQ